MLTKAIKPGQLFTANKKVFRCCKQTVEESYEFVCKTCERENCEECIAYKNDFNCYKLGRCYPKRLV